MKRNLWIIALLLITAVTSSVVTHAFSSPGFVGPHPLGLSLIGPAADPSGNGMESYQVVYTDNSGTIYTSGFYLQVHNSAGIRGYSVAAPGGSSAVFEMCSSNSSMVVTGINGANCN
jgi:hypothetical protein